MIQAEEVFLYFLEQFGLRDGATQPHGEMNVISDSADAVCFELGIAANSGEIGMHAGANLSVKQGLAVFGAEDNVNEDLAERLRHVVAGGRYEAGLQPAIHFAAYEPRALPWAGMTDAFGV